VKRLKVGNIILFKRKKGLLQYLIRKASGSYWTHTALVFQVSKISAFPPSVLIVEASQTGIEVHRLETYLNQLHLYDIGFKRMNDLTGEERERFRGFFLDAVDTPYDRRRLRAYFLHHYFERLTGKNYSHWVTKETVNPNNYLCTTFAQRAYYLAVAPKKRPDVLFRPMRPDMNFIERMEFITPGDVASSENTTWLFNPHL